MVLSREVSQEVLKYSLHHAKKPVKLVPQERLSAKGMEVLSLAAKGMSRQGDRSPPGHK